jgi:hypothetical protein
MSLEEQQSLIKRYRKMATADIVSRIHSGKLSLHERLVADDELAQRQAHPQTERPAPSYGNPPWQVALTVFGGALLMGGMAYWIMSSEFFALIALALIISIATLIGKAFPKFGMTVGVLLAASPLFLGAYMWHVGALAWHGGDFRPLGTLIAWGFLIFASGLAIALGAAFIRGARHKGSWAQLEADIHAERSDALQDMRKLN